MFPLQYSNIEFSTNQGEDLETTVARTPTPTPTPTSSQLSGGTREIADVDKLVTIMNEQLLLLKLLVIMFSFLIVIKIFENRS